MLTIPRAMPIREKPNNPVSPDFRPGLFIKRAPGPEGRVSTSERRPAKRVRRLIAGHDARLAPADGGPPSENDTMPCFA